MNAAAVVIQGNSDPATVRNGSPDEARLISAWLDQTRVPGHMQRYFDRFQRDRNYIGEELFGNPHDKATMSVNLVAKAVDQRLTKVMPTNADLSVRHQRSVGSRDMARKDGIRRAALDLERAGIPLRPQVLMAAAAEAEQQYMLELGARERFAMTSEAILKRLMDDAGGTEEFQELGRQAFTVGASCLKVGWQRDMHRDIAGRFRVDDSQDQMGLLALRAAEFAAGEFGDGDAKHAELVRLSDYARQHAEAVLQRQADPGSLTIDQWEQVRDTRAGTPVPPGWGPEIEAFEGAVVSTVKPELLRWDWRIPFHRAIKESPYIMEGIPMDPDEVAVTYGLTPAERNRLGGSNRRDGYRGQDGMTQRAPGGDTDQDPNEAHYEDAVQGGKVIVWERWDRRLRRHCLFVAGLDFFLLDEVPGVVGPNFYPYVLYGPWVIDGQMMPSSIVRFLRKVMDAINQKLTDEQQSLWAAMQRYIVKKGSFRPGELEKLMGAVPHDVIECEEPQDILKSFQALPADTFNPAMFNLDQLFRLFELVAGMSLSELGVVGNANFAKEAEISAESSAETAGRDAHMLSVAITEAFKIILAYAVASLDQRAVRARVGNLAYWPEPASREDMMMYLSVEVAAAGSQSAATSNEGQKLRDAMTAIGQALALRQQAYQQGMALDIEPLVRRALRVIDPDTPVREMMSFDTSGLAAMAGGMPQALPGAQAGPGATPGQSQPDPSGGAMPPPIPA